jgi:hypothetical protein
MALASPVRISGWGGPLPLARALDRVLGQSLHASQGGLGLLAERAIGVEQNTPTKAALIASNWMRFACETAATTNPAAPKSIASVRCHTRSPETSLDRPHHIIAAAVAPPGNATMKPTSRFENPIVCTIWGSHSRRP